MTNNRTKIHTVYKAQDGKRVPSVTTILGILNKPALMQWAWQCGVDGLDYRQVRDQAGDIGTLAHYLIMCHLSGLSPDVSEYSQQDVDKAENSLIKFWDWEKEHTLSPVLIEQALVSEIHGFGGTVDFYGMVDDLNTLLDFKTGKAIYTEHFCQLAAYKSLLQENGNNVDSVRILRIGRDETEGFEERHASNLDKQWEKFTHCLAIYNLDKAIRKD